MEFMYGMPTLFELKSIEENVLLCNHLGLDFLEINMNMFYCLPANNEIRKLKQLSEKYNIKYTMHFPEEIDFGTYYDVISESNIRLFEELTIWGSKIGVEKINIHINPGTYITLPNEKVWAYESNKEMFIKNLLSSLRKIIKFASKYNIMVCIENTFVPTFMEDIFDELSEIDNLYFTYDVGHDAKDDYRSKEQFYNLNKKVKHMHLHDYDGKTDHQILFNGNIDLNNRLSFAKSNNMSVVIEVKTVEALMTSINNLKIRRFI